MLAPEGRVVELLGAGMRLEVSMSSLAAKDSGDGGGADDPAARVVRLLTAAFRLAVRSPDLVHRALAGRAWAWAGLPGALHVVLWRTASAGAGTC